MTTALQVCGIHCGSRSSGWILTSDRPAFLNFAASHCALSWSDDVPVMRPQNFGWTVVAIAAGDQHLLDDIAVHALAVDRGIALGARRQRPSQKRIVELWIEVRAGSYAGRLRCGGRLLRTAALTRKR